MQQGKRLGLVSTAAIVAVVAAACNPITARNEGREASAKGSLRAIQSAQIVFAIDCNNFYAPTLTALGGEPASGGGPFLSQDLAAADTVEKMGYRIWIDAVASPDAPPCQGLSAGKAARSYVIRAEPIPGEGERFFAMTDQGDIYQHSASVRFVDGAPSGGAERVP